MAALSISRAWDEAKARIASDGRLMMVVAAALIAFPALIMAVVSPATSRSDANFVDGVIILVTSLIAVIGQLAIIRMSIGQSLSVGEAIGHGARRMPIYVIAGILILAALIIAAIPFVLVLIVAGVPLDEAAIIRSPVAALVSLVYFALVCFVAIRMLMTSPVASEEGVGPVAILRRSWELTEGHWWRLFGFIILFLIGAAIVMLAIQWVSGSIVVAFLGPVEPMSASALVVGLIDSIINATITTFLAVLLARIYVQLSGRESLDVSVPKTGT